MPSLGFDREAFQEAPVLGILRGVSQDAILGVASAAVSAGLKHIEITFNTPGAPALIEKAVKLDPMSLWANNAYSRSLVDFGRFEEAEQVIRHMKKISPNRRSALNNAYYYLRQTQYRYDEATYYALQRYRYNPVGYQVRLNG